jgi:hypothetical protein
MCYFTQDKVVYSNRGHHLNIPTLTDKAIFSLLRRNLSGLIAAHSKKGHQVNVMSKEG